MEILFDNVSFGFIDSIIKKDLKLNKKYKSINTRFPPEPNGYLHIGHAKAIFINFGLALKYKGKCNLRFNDTNPNKEDKKFIESIKKDIKWLGFDWGKNEYNSSDYFEKMYYYAIVLIKKEKAYVCELSPKQIKENRGTLKKIGKNSPFRNRSIKENLILFEKMKKGFFEEESMVLRAKIDMNSPNINMRDPVLYRILKSKHHNTGNKWFIYPTYDFAHPLEDAFEGITHSLCSLEFENHRPLYEWILQEYKSFIIPKQIEFARLNINNTVMSKRKLRYLVDNNLVKGWDDPRMPTIQGFRRRGYTANSILKFILNSRISKANSILDIKQLEAIIREELNYKAKRAMAIIDPIKIIITNFPSNKTIWIESEINPEQKNLGKRKIPFTKELYIEKEDFMINPIKGFRRLYIGNEVRLKDAFYITCLDYKIEKNKNITVYCSYDPKSKRGWTNDGRKVKGTIHWVSEKYGVISKIRLYNKLFNFENPEKETEKIKVNENSFIEKNGIIEDYLKDVLIEESFQFLRKGYFIKDIDSKKDCPVFNRIVGLKDSFKKNQ